MRETLFLIEHSLHHDFDCDPLEENSVSAFQVKKIRKIARNEEDCERIRPEKS